MKAIIFANGKPKDGVMVQRALAEAAGALIIAADGGARVALRYHLVPHVIIGDMDSLAPEEITALKLQDALIQQYPSEKNETDLELALLYAVQQGADWIRIVGAIGGRFDQMLANVYLMALPALVGCDVALVARKQLIRLLFAGDHQVMGDAGDTISLIPLSGDVHGITTENLKYPLVDESLFVGPARGVSNVMLTEHATISVSSGTLICVHTKGRA